MTTRAIYRDDDTGQFVSRETWEADHGPDGKYHREYVEYEDFEEFDLDFIDLEEDEY